MQQLLIFYLVILFLLVGVMLLLLLWKEENAPANQITTKDKFLLASATAIGCVILQLIWLMIPQGKPTPDNLTFVVPLALLVLACASSGFLLYSVVRQARKRRSWKVYVNGDLVTNYYPH